MDSKFIKSSSIIDYAIIAGHFAHQRLPPNSYVVGSLKIVATFTKPRFVYGGV